MGKGGHKGKSKGGKGRGSPYKTDLCVFFEKGLCEKGSSCPYAHGVAELRGDAQSQGQWLQDADVMSWLKEQREQGGSAGTDFEDKWKAWCRAHSLSELAKAERIQSIYAFRESLTVEETVATRGQLACPKGHVLSAETCGKEEYECDCCGRDIKAGQRFYDCRDCDYSMCKECGQSSTAKKTKLEKCGVEKSSTRQKPKAAEQSKLPPRKDSIEHAAKPPVPASSEPRTIWNASVESVREKLLAAVDDRHLKQALHPDWISGSAWQRLAGQALEHAAKCEARCAEMAGSFLNADGVHALARTCMARQNLAAVFSVLRLEEMLLEPDTMVESEDQQAKVSAAFVAELLSGAGGSGATAARAITDFICLVGLSHFVAEGVVQTIVSASNDQASTSPQDEDGWDSVPKPDTLEGQASTSQSAKDADGPKTVQVQDEDEDTARARRVQAQEQRKANARWDYTGGYRAAELSKRAESESNEEAMLRMIASWREKKRGADAKPSSGAESRNIGSRGLASAGNREAETSETRNFKRDICIYFQQGRCDKGERCTFAHGRTELLDAKYEVHHGPSWESGSRYTA
mmetsp:Transcript_69283/g.122616  ORF Transcript_69283/g.122616 Transcript_69283/m.122616 type:complete len:577 (+) Transcript_69283:92-1822(+)